MLEIYSAFPAVSVTMDGQRVTFDTAIWGHVLEMSAELLDVAKAG